MVIMAVAILILYTTTAFSGQSLASLVKTEHKRHIVDSVTVKPESYEALRIGAPDGATNARIIGNFVVDGDNDELANRDIIVTIQSEDEFLKSVDNRDSETYYYSGKVSQGSVEVSVPAGQTIYLVFNNTFELYSEKQITAQFDLFYEQ